MKTKSPVTKPTATKLGQPKALPFNIDLLLHKMERIEADNYQWPRRALNNIRLLAKKEFIYYLSAFDDETRRMALIGRVNTLLATMDIHDLWTLPHTIELINAMRTADTTRGAIRKYERP